MSPASPTTQIRSTTPTPVSRNFRYCCPDEGYSTTAMLFAVYWSQNHGDATEPARGVIGRGVPPSRAGHSCRVVSAGGTARYGDAQLYNRLVRFLVRRRPARLQERFFEAA